MRLHELAKEMEADSKELLALAKKLGLPVKSHSSKVEPGVAGILRVGWRFRDLDEDEIYDKLEEDAEQREADKKAEEEAKRVDRERRKAEREAAEHEEPEPEPEDEGEGVVDDSGADLELVGEDEPAAVEAAAEDPPAQVAEQVEESPTAETVSSEEPAAPAATTEAAPAPAAAAAQADPAKAAETKAAEKPADATAEADAAKPEGAEGEAKPAAPRGAKILGRIQLDTETIAKSERTHEQLERELSPNPTAGRRSGETRRSDDAAARRRKGKGAGPTGTTKWSPEQDDLVLGANQVARARYWDRSAQRRQARRGGGRRSRGPKKNILADKTVTVVAPLSVKDFSQDTGIPVGQILGKMLQAGTPLNINSTLDEEMCLMLAVEFNRDIDVQSQVDVEKEFLAKELAPAVAEGDEEDGEISGETRPPVVTFMGHVDHGKTSLIDQIRKTRVVDGEHGGITQHTRAYRVETPGGGVVTVLDTPGHRAFTEMRARGASVTDVVVLVVAADDGVMPQTKEAIEHSRAAREDMPIVVALNKIDKPDADQMRVKQELMAADILPEEFGGTFGVIETSAINGEGIDSLLERLDLEAELHEFRGDPERNAVGYVIEASKEEGKGIVATVLVRDGTLRPRDVFLCGSSWGRVRRMEDEHGRQVKEAGPSTPVRVFGFKGHVPAAGEQFLSVDDEKGAEDVAQERAVRAREAEAAPRQAVTLDSLFASLDAEKVKEVCVVVKADVQGSVQVLKRELEALHSDEVRVRVLRAAVGGITEEDIVLAASSKAIIVGFGVAPDAKARRLQDRHGVEIRSYNVIYELLDDMKKAMVGMLSPEESEQIVGHVEIRQTFKVSRIGTIAGCYVLDGKIRRSDKVRLIRDGKVMATTTLDSLKRFKDDVREVVEGYECGLKLHGYDDIKVGDTVEAFEVVLEARELSIG